jgi:hypothetical protein
VAGNDFTLVVVSDTNWTWDRDAVVAAITATLPQADTHDGYPLAGRCPLSSHDGIG